MPRNRAEVRRAGVVVIGGGAMGTSTAFHLARLGVEDIVLIEQDALGSGSTGKAAGGIRLQFADELNVRLMQRSVAAFERFGEDTGADIGFHQVGYLFLLDDPGHVALFEQAVELQRRLGVPTRWVSVDEVQELVPQVDPAALIGATYCPHDGYATPEAVVQGYATSAAGMGVAIRQSCRALDVVASGDRILAVRTTRGTIETSCVVCVAGTGSKAIGGMVGLELPVWAEAHWLHYSDEALGFAEDLPLTIDFSTGVYLHREGPGLVLGGREAELERVAAAATRRFPLLADMHVRTSWWGDYDMSPDRNAMVGEHPELSRFFYATGFSGHGFQQAPAIGEHLAELVAGREPTLDLRAFEAGRFMRQEARHETFVV